MNLLNFQNPLQGATIYNQSNERMSQHRQSNLSRADNFDFDDFADPIQLIDERPYF